MLPIFNLPTSKRWYKNIFHVAIIVARIVTFHDAFFSSLPYRFRKYHVFLEKKYEHVIFFNF